MKRPHDDPKTPITDRLHDLYQLAGARPDVPAGVLGAILRATTRTEKWEGTRGTVITRVDLRRFDKALRQWDKKHRGSISRL